MVARDGVVPEVLAPACGERVPPDERGGDLVALRDGAEAGDRAGRVADDREAVAHGGPPALEQVHFEAIALGERDDRGPVVRPRGLDTPVDHHGREEELADDRALDEKQHVGGAAPQLLARGLAQLAA